MGVGRKPTPTALKVLKGNPGKRPLNETEPRPTGHLTCPSHLSKVAKTEWKRIVKEVKAIGLLTSVDRAALTAYCESWSRYVEASENIQKFGSVIKSPNGYPIINPYVSIANKALEMIFKYGVEFGFTPSSRSRLHVNPVQQVAGSEDEFAEFIDGNPDEDERKIQ
jgi:P27 family predicted phage terminase small subunit